MEIICHPAPDRVEMAMRCATTLLDRIAMRRLTNDERKERGVDSLEFLEFGISSAEANFRISLGDIVPVSVSYLWTSPDSSFTQHAIPFASQRCVGWSDETVSKLVAVARNLLLHCKKQTAIADDEVSSLRKTIAAVSKTAGQLQSELNRSLTVGQKQRKQAVEAGKSRIPLHPEQVQAAIGEIESRLAQGVELQPACKELAPKYGVHFSTLKRYYQKR